MIWNLRGQITNVEEGFITRRAPCCVCVWCDFIEGRKRWTVISEQRWFILVQSIWQNKDGLWDWPIRGVSCSAEENWTRVNQQEQKAETFILKFICFSDGGIFWGQNESKKWYFSSSLSEIISHMAAGTDTLLIQPLLGSVAAGGGGWEP